MKQENTITLYPKEYNGKPYHIDKNIKNFEQWNSHLMGKTWYVNNSELQNEFKSKWNRKEKI